MKIVTQTGRQKNTDAIIEKIGQIADAGFDAYDISLFDLFPNPDKPEIHDLEKDDYMTYVKRIKTYADSRSLLCTQAHAPFPSSVGDPERDKAIYDRIVRSMKIAAYLGADVIVVHPKQHLNYAEHAAELFEMNVAFYRELMPIAEELGITIATENMWQRNCGARVPTDSVCSRAWEFNKLIDTVGSPFLVGCLDVGHTALMGTDMETFIHAMGKERLKALHVHDNDFTQDSHTLPFTLKMDFHAIARALGEIDYQGEFTFEADNFLKPFPSELRTDALRLMHSVGAYLVQQIERNRK